MLTLEKKNDLMYMRAIWLAFGLAVFTAVSYFLMAANVLGVGDLQPQEGSPVIIYVAAGCYLFGGLLILLRRRWLWIIGAVMNGLVILFFVNLYAARPAVLFSAGGLASKSAQLLLEVSLVYLIIRGLRRPRRADQ